jgi:hypothetical protein
MKNMSSKKYCEKVEIIIGKKWIVILAVKKAMFVWLGRRQRKYGFVHLLFFVQSHNWSVKGIS